MVVAKIRAATQRAKSAEMLLANVMVQVTVTVFGGGGTTPRHYHDVNDICRANLWSRCDLTSLVVVAKIRATTQRVESIRECGTDDVCEFGHMQRASGARGIPCTRKILSAYSVRPSPVGFGGGVSLHCDG